MVPRNLRGHYVLQALARHAIIVFHSWYFGLVALIRLYRIAEVDFGLLLLLVYDLLLHS